MGVVYVDVVKDTCLYYSLDFEDTKPDPGERVLACLARESGVPQVLVKVLAVRVKLYKGMFGYTVCYRL